MLTQMPNAHHDIASKERSYTDNYPPAIEHGMEDRQCPGCRKSVINESGGLVVAFGQSFFHVDCFKCAKCGNQVTADTNLLLLSDGSPICANCSYNCNVCHLPILDEAIMTGDDSYHAHCFKCKVCKNRIDDLVFAKTTQGIYCMNCHSERMIRLRRHAQRKLEKTKANGGLGAFKPPDQDHRNTRKENAPSRDIHSHPHADPLRFSDQSHAGATRPPFSLSTPSNGAHTQVPTPPFSPPAPQTSPRPSQTQPLSITVAPPEQYQSILPNSSPPRNASNTHPHSSDTNSEHQRRTEKLQTLPVSTTHDSHASSTKRRNSYDDGVRPLNHIVSKTAPSEKYNTFDGHRPNEDANVQASSSSSRGEKLRTKHPGLVLTNFGSSSRSTTAPAVSPSAMTFGTKSPAAHGQDLVISSPLREQISDRNSGSTAFATPMSSPSVGEFISRTLASSPEATHIPSPQTPVSRGRHGSNSLFTNELDHTTPTRGLHSAASANNEIPRTNTFGLSSSPKESIGLAEAPSQRSLSPNLIVNGRTLHPRQSPDNRRRSYDVRRLSSNPNPEVARSRSPSKSRPDSPAHRADVPHNIGSGTDTESDSLSINGQEKNTVSPPSPSGNQSLTVSSNDVDPDLSITSQTNSVDGTDDLLESSPVEHTSHSTFIAPALPPIRFSMNGSNFSDLLGAVGQSSLKEIEELPHFPDSRSDSVSPTPPSTSSSFDAQRPMSDVTVVASHGYGSSRTSLVDDDTTVVWKSDETDNINTLRASNDFERLRNAGSPTLLDSQPRSILSTGLADSPARVTLSEPTFKAAATMRDDTSTLVIRRLQEALTDANERGAQQLKLDKPFVEAILTSMEHKSKTYAELKNKFDGMKRTSKQYIEGLTVAQTEYDKELKARRDAEAEVTRLRVLVSGQAARLSAQSGDVKRQKLREQMTKQLHENLTGLEQDLSKLRVERDMTLVEMEELSASKAATNSEAPAANLGRSLTTRLDNLKTHYLKELTPLTQQHEALTREIAELKAVRDVFLEETTVLNARNEELAKLSAQYTRRMDSDPAPTSKAETTTGKNSSSFDKHRPLQSGAIAPPFGLAASRSSSYSDDMADPNKGGKAQKSDGPDFPTPLSKRNFMKWPGSKAKEPGPTPQSALDNNGKGKGSNEHVFQQYSLLRFTRCDHCGDKMWGSQVRCSLCNISVHGRCMQSVHLGCSQQLPPVREDGQNMVSPPSMFGRDLIEQVRADSAAGPRKVPVIVEKCIEAVEKLALDYEGIYRKTGGSGQSKIITQLFERGDYLAFDLRDSDRFNDICSVTSVLKTYFRSLPIPLLTFDWHDAFMRAIEIKDNAQKHKAMGELINKLPDEHYYTLRMLMLHLNRVMEHSEKNLMTARNLGVVFGPTLMRSRDPGAEFSDMAGKALSVEWLVENAPLVFNQASAV